MDRTQQHLLGDILLIALCAMLRCGGLCRFRGFRQGSPEVAAQLPRTAQWHPQPRDLPPSLRAARSQGVCRLLSPLDPKPAHSHRRRDRGHRRPDPPVQSRPGQRQGTHSHGQRMGARKRAGAGPAQGQRPEPRTKRSEITKGRSLCPKGSAGGRWQITAIPELLQAWKLDVSFAEDQCRVRTGYADQNLCVLRHMSINILKRETTKKRGMKGKQKYAAWDQSYLLTLLRF